MRRLRFPSGLFNSAHGDPIESAVESEQQPRAATQINRSVGKLQKNLNLPSS